MTEYPVAQVAIVAICVVAVLRAVLGFRRSERSGHLRAVDAAKGGLGGAMFTVALIAATGGALSAYGTTTGQWRSVPILSGSMSPTIDKGDIAIVVPLAYSDIAVGDIIVFNAPQSAGAVRAGEPVIHRVIEVVDPSELVGSTPDARYLRTQGDNNEDPDRWIVEIDEDVWVQNATIRDVGEMFLLIAQPSARSGLLIAAAVLFAAAAVSQVIAGRREEEDVEPDPAANEVGEEPAAPGHELEGLTDYLDAYFAHAPEPSQRRPPPGPPVEPSAPPTDRVYEAMATERVPAQP